MDIASSKNLQNIQPKLPVRLPVIISPSGTTHKDPNSKRTTFTAIRSPTPRPILPAISDEQGSSNVGLEGNEDTGSFVLFDLRQQRRSPTRASGSTRGIISSNASRGSDSNRTRLSQNTYFGSPGLQLQPRISATGASGSGSGGGVGGIRGPNGGTSLSAAPNNSRQTFFSSGVISNSNKKYSGGRRSSGTGDESTSTTSSSEVSSSWLDVTNLSSYPSFAEHDWMSDSESELDNNIQQILRMSVITNQGMIKSSFRPKQRHEIC
ncbi:uncharacterized protein LOC142351494 [Convolutriloba macropyga]|uniref:uncharacterized protein LOC142351494 n=1 Tax=Convolutriloba macropyga TaxID=536237 RepID=UPI003F521BEF